jgi:hypothetical protein
VRQPQPAVVPARRLANLNPDSRTSFITTPGVVEGPWYGTVVTYTNDNQSTRHPATTQPRVAPPASPPDRGPGHAVVDRRAIPPGPPAAGFVKEASNEGAPACASVRLSTLRQARRVVSVDHLRSTRDQRRARRPPSSLRDASPGARPLLATTPAAHRPRQLTSGAPTSTAYPPSPAGAWASRYTSGLTRPTARPRVPPGTRRGRLRPQLRGRATRIPLSPSHRCAPGPAAAGSNPVWSPLEREACLTAGKPARTLTLHPRKRGTWLHWTRVPTSSPQPRRGARARGCCAPTARARPCPGEVPHRPH